MSRKEITVYSRHANYCYRIFWSKNHSGQHETVVVVEHEADHDAADCIRECIGKGPAGYAYDLQEKIVEEFPRGDIVGGSVKKCVAWVEQCLRDNVCERY